MKEDIWLTVSNAGNSGQKSELLLEDTVNYTLQSKTANVEHHNPAVVEVKFYPLTSVHFASSKKVCTITSSVHNASNLYS